MKISLNNDFNQFLTLTEPCNGYVLNVRQSVESWADYSFNLAPTKNDWIEIFINDKTNQIKPMVLQGISNAIAEYRDELNSRNIELNGFDIEIEIHSYHIIDTRSRGFKYSFLKRLHTFHKIGRFEKTIIRPEETLSYFKIQDSEQLNEFLENLKLNQTPKSALFSNRIIKLVLSASENQLKITKEIKLKIIDPQKKKHVFNLTISPIKDGEIERNIIKIQLLNLTKMSLAYVYSELNFGLKTLNKKFNIEGGFLLTIDFNQNHEERSPLKEALIKVNSRYIIWSLMNYFVLNKGSL